MLNPHTLQKAHDVLAQLELTSAALDELIEIEADTSVYPDRLRSLRSMTGAITGLQTELSKLYS